MYSSFKENSSLVNGSDQPFWTRVDSNKKVAPTKPQTNPGVCWKWLMAGPVTCIKQNEDPSTCSPTKKPTVAIVASDRANLSFSSVGEVAAVNALAKAEDVKTFRERARAIQASCGHSLMSACLRDLSD